MAKTFEHFHLSLIEREQSDILISEMPREEWLRQTFQEPFTFSHRGNEFHWVPNPKVFPDILATVERQTTRVQHLPPDEGAGEIEAPEWQGSLVVIDPLHKPDGQKLAFEVDTNVGAPSAILASLVSYLNDRPAQYAIVIHPLFDSESFWEFTRRHGGLVEEVTFKFAVPNMFFGASTSVDEGLRRIGADTKAQEVEITLSADDGVAAQSNSVQDAMAYAEAGNGTVTAKALNGDKYSSTERRKTSKITEIITGTSEGLRDLMSRDLGHVENNSLGDNDRSNNSTSIT